MAYYRGDYYRGKGRGDYYRGMKGDPGFWSALGKGLGFVAKAVFGIPSVAPGGAAPAAASVQTPPFTGGGGFSLPSAFTRLPPIQQETRIKQLPPGASGPFRPDVELMPGMRRRRRMNASNVKALRRSLRRVTSFGNLCKSTRKAISHAASSVQVQHRGSRVQRLLPAGRGK